MGAMNASDLTSVRYLASLRLVPGLGPAVAFTAAGRGLMVNVLVVGLGPVVLTSAGVPSLGLSRAVLGDSDFLTAWEGNSTLDLAGLGNGEVPLLAVSGTEGGVVIVVVGESHSMSLNVGLWGLWLISLGWSNVPVSRMKGGFQRYMYLWSAFPRTARLSVLKGCPPIVDLPSCRRSTRVS